MENREAIEYINWMRDKFITDKPLEACDLAISALEKLEVSLKSIGRDNDSVPVTEMNIDYGKRKEPHKSEQIIVRLGG